MFFSLAHTYVGADGHQSSGLRARKPILAPAITFCLGSTSRAAPLKPNDLRCSGFPSNSCSTPAQRPQALRFKRGRWHAEIVDRINQM
jgi:hypothetical protein